MSNPLPYGYSLPYDQGLLYNSPGSSGAQSQNSSGSGTTQPTPKNGENSSATLLLYLKDGTTIAAYDSWLADGKLHYLATDGSERTIELDTINFQRTVDENARRGVPFTLRPNPRSHAAQ